jgi:hypothetical protein
LSLVIDPHWQRARYLLMQCLGVFYLLGGHGLRELLKLLPRTVPRRLLWQAGLAASLTILLIWPGLTPLSWSFNVGYIGWDRYDLAFKHAAAHMSEGDKIMTMHPPASLIYLGRDDYYLVQSSAKLIVRPDGSLGDRYTGATFVETADQFNDIVARPDRLWLVSQEFWLFNSYDGYLQQNILWRMDKLWGEGGVWALAARPGTWPLARDMAVPVDGEFEGGTRLLGFTANPPQLQPDGIVWLTLFWGGDTIPYNRKVFVQLRDAANNSVAQADHFIYDDKVPSNRWKDLFKNDFAIRDGVTLQLPSELAPGTYHLYVGFYHPETFERVGVVNDQSGEAAVILGEFIVP